MGSLPSLFYIDAFISPEEEQRLLEELRSSRQWKTVSGGRQSAPCIVNVVNYATSHPRPAWVQGAGCRTLVDWCTRKA